MVLEENQIPCATEVKNRYYELRKLRLSGQLSEYGSGLISLAQSLQTQNDPDLARLLEVLKYGGATLNETELRVYERRIELYIEPKEQE